MYTVLILLVRETIVQVFPYIVIPVGVVFIGWMVYREIRMNGGIQIHLQETPDGRAGPSQMV